MARVKRKPIEEKIQHQQEIIESLEIRLEHERNELEALFSQQKHNEVESLYDFIKESGLGTNEAIEVLQQYLTENYSETA